MAFMNNNGFNNQNNQQQGDKPKTNFNIGKLHGEDGIMNVTMWVSDKKSIFTIFSIKQANHTIQIFGFIMHHCRDNILQNI